MMKDTPNGILYALLPSDGWQRNIFPISDNISGSVVIRIISIMNAYT